MEIFSGIVGLIIATALLALILCWILFPFLVISSLKEVRKSIDKLNENTEILLTASERYMTEMLKRK